jgi:hypothetical protein
MAINVYGSAAVPVQENLSLLNANKLRGLFSIHAGRGDEGGCGHSSLKRPIRGIIQGI